MSGMRRLILLHTYENFISLTLPSSPFGQENVPCLPACARATRLPAFHGTRLSPPPPHGAGPRTAGADRCAASKSLECAKNQECVECLVVRHM